MGKSLIPEASAELSEAESTISSRAAAVTRAEQRQGYQALTAPVGGTVNEVAVTTVGDVVASGDPLVTIVPNDRELVVETMILNRDRGLLREGDKVRVKVDALPYTRYGHIDGVLERFARRDFRRQKRVGISGASEAFFNIDSR